MTHKLLRFGLLVMLFLLTTSSRGTLVAAQSGDAYSLIDAVNQLRAAHGLPALQVNNILMGIAQGHSQYMGSIGSCTHDGAGGSRPKDRAAAAGYGGGATFYLSENIACGMSFDAQAVVQLWTGDDLHLNTMLGASYQDIGAGVATVGDVTYYTIDVGYVVGSGSYNPPTSTPSPGPGTPSVTPRPTAIPVYLVRTATPNPDGSLIHVVLSGQTLIGIAEAYGVTVAEIKALNDMTSDEIYVGDHLIIRLGRTPGPTGTATKTNTPTREPTSTRFPTRTLTSTLRTPGAAQPAAILHTSTPPVSEKTPDPVGNILLGAIIVLGVIGVGLMVAGSLLRRSPAGPVEPES